MGLNKDLDGARGRILGTELLPNIREAFSEIRREESRRKVMTESTNLSPTVESFALAVHASRGFHQSSNADNRPRRGRPWCDHCRKPGHLIGCYWKIHGKPVE